MAEQLFASFLLDRDQGLEIAIAAESVTEATPLTETIQPLPASVPFLEGIMHLRDAVIPIINLKKRMGLKGPSTYDKDAKIAVVLLANQTFGLIFDDIKEVLRVDESLLMPIQPALQSDDYIISDLINLPKQNRTLEVLDLNRLFDDSKPFTDQVTPATDSSKESMTRSYSRYVIFSCGDREYGVPVENSRELTFTTEIDDMFKTGCLEGALQLRGQTIPVMNAGALLNGGIPTESDEQSRILVMNSDALRFGVVIDKIIEILTVCNEEILCMPPGGDQSIDGIYEPLPNRNIMLLNVSNLVSSQLELLESMANIKGADEEQGIESLSVSESRHLITENCYLIFSITKHFAIELKDVQELIEHSALMPIPGAQGFDSRVLNLRGQIIPVVNLRSFYNFPEQEQTQQSSRLIICRDGNHVVALHVDNIVTIYKQEEFHSTPSLNPQLQPKKDTLDRLIEFSGNEGVTEHVLVVNTHNLINNHLHQESSTVHPINQSKNNNETIHPLAENPQGEI